MRRDLTVANLLSVQRQVVDRIATGLSVKLSADTQGGTASMPTTNLAAYSAYLLPLQTRT